VAFMFRNCVKFSLLETDYRYPCTVEGCIWSTTSCQIYHHQVQRVASVGWKTSKSSCKLLKFWHMHCAHLDSNK